MRAIVVRLKGILRYAQDDRMGPYPFHPTIGSSVLTAIG